MFNSITKTQAFFIGAAVASVVYSALDLLQAKVEADLSAAFLEQALRLTEEKEQESFDKN